MLCYMFVFQCCYLYYHYKAIYKIYHFECGTLKNDIFSTQFYVFLPTCKKPPKVL